MCITVTQDEQNVGTLGKCLLQPGQVEEVRARDQRDTVDAVHLHEVPQVA